MKLVQILCLAILAGGLGGYVVCHLALGMHTDVANGVGSGLAAGVAFQLIRRSRR